MKYSFVLHTPNGNLSVGAYESLENTVISDFRIQTKRTQKEKYELIEIEVSSKEEREVYISLSGEGAAPFYSFNGSCADARIFRQSPRDPRHYHFKMQKSAVPMVAAVCGGEADVFISDNPSYFDNATTQHIIPAEKRFYLSSGDPGGTPNYPESDPFSPSYHKIGG